ncbi:mechanosensitive ion channel protein [Acidithiobacillus marinus]|uniref:Mechanosensitive ion channel protein n=1 Tax=Acidithiobacillus marinus TaxID=187490 RepID=A0A2I1DMV2_9PROT|nr:mechanosensitive ion channel domain-containing protein [Acidithiobacillus marinus]PKY11207.1 mechanosensitive ion channel protein [Acidithiobacillus marinus]
MQQLLAWNKSINTIKHDAKNCLDKKNKQLEQTDNGLEILGPAVAEEPENLTALRVKLTNRQKNLRGEIATCKVLTVASTDLAEEVDSAKESLHARILLRRDQNIWEQFTILTAVSGYTWGQEKNYWLVHHDHFILAQKNVQIAIAIGLFVFLLLLVVRKSLPESAAHGTQLSAAQKSLYHYLPIIAGVTATAVIAHFMGVFSPLVRIILFTWGTYALLAILVTWALRPSGMVFHHFAWGPKSLRSTLRNLRFIALLAGFAIAWLLTAPQDYLNSQQQAFFWSAYHLVMLGAVFRLVWVAGAKKPFRAYPFLRIIILLALATTVVFTLLGYRNLTGYLFFGLLMSLLAFGCGLFISWGLSDFWNYTAQKNGRWQHALKQRLGLNDDQPLPWLSWFSALSHIAVWLAVAAFVLFAWGLTHAGFSLIWKYFITGFSVGTFHVQPFRWIIAIVLLILLFNINAFIQRYLSENSRIIGHLESGARHSILSIVRYTGFIIAILVALSTAGVALQNLAIIAGALSVGIGFGLQNIVNNFVSGLILLLERPIRVGDWIQVGSTQGTVQKMSIRYTLILTFDRTEVFIPNSELISGQVTNWMYTNNVLRLMIPFNVAHNADIALVKELLVKEGQNHPDVLQDDPRGIPPTALLLDVSENALQFYLRVYLDDCNKSFYVQTDLRSAVVESLLRHNIRLAHQQQDVHIIPSQILPINEATGKAQDALESGPQ